MLHGSSFFPIESPSCRCSSACLIVCISWWCDFFICLKCFESSEARSCLKFSLWGAFRWGLKLLPLLEFRLGYVVIIHVDKRSITQSTTYMVFIRVLPCWIILEEFCRTGNTFLKFQRLFAAQQVFFRFMSHDLGWRFNTMLHVVFKWFTTGPALLSTQILLKCGRWSRQITSDRTFAYANVWIVAHVWNLVATRHLRKIGYVQPILRR